MEKVARDNWQQWGDESEDASLTRILNDNSYDYRGYYNKYPKGVGNAQNHWTDEFKTVWHPSFSIESKYSGKKSQYNPYGYPGGTCRWPQRAETAFLRGAGDGVRSALPRAACRVTGAFFHCPEGPGKPHTYALGHCGNLDRPAVCVLLCSGMGADHFTGAYL